MNELAAMPAFGADLSEARFAYLMLTSLGIGLLIGLERERNPRAKAGLRTCALVGLFGTTCALVGGATGSPWMVPAGLALVGAFIVAAYLNEERGEETDSGTTTVIAVLLCYVFGVMVWIGAERQAVALGIVSALLLHFKPQLHGFTARLSQQDVSSILQFAVLTFIVLPLLPDTGYGPGGVLNPRHVWWMVVLISGLDLAGYLALKMVGSGGGALLVGIFGGLVSSTATTAVYARRAAAEAGLVPLASSVIVTSNLIVPARVAVVAAVTTPAVLPHLLPMVGAALLAAALPVLTMVRQVAGQGGSEAPVLTNPTRLRVALGFAVLYGAVLAGASWFSHLAGDLGLYGLAVVSGLVDVDAITLSSLQLFQVETVTAKTAMVAIAVAYASNLVFKLGIIATAGHAALLRACLPGLVAPVGGMALALTVL